jgi:hypothetical protein
MEKENRRAGAALGWAVYGSIGVGIISVLAAVLYIFNDGQAAALCLIAGALAFGLLANALLRQ